MISRKEAEAEETIRRLRISNNVRQTIADIRYSVTEDQGIKSFHVLNINNIFLSMQLFTQFVYHI